mmetsp:Transcript_30398/g.71407  ORF Transcript_30398/g.71407 Transcript_30398/m.71407 type:complete len:214 (+) Transcript_30398:139-780(+)
MGLEIDAVLGNPSVNNIKSVPIHHYFFGVARKGGKLQASRRRVEGCGFLSRQHCRDLWVLHHEELGNSRSGTYLDPPQLRARPGQESDPRQYCQSVCGSVCFTLLSRANRSGLGSVSLVAGNPRRRRSERNGQRAARVHALGVCKRHRHGCDVFGDWFIVSAVGHPSFTTPEHAPTQLQGFASRSVHYCRLCCHVLGARHHERDLRPRRLFFG